MSVHYKDVLFRSQVPELAIGQDLVLSYREGHPGKGAFDNLAKGIYTVCYRTFLEKSGFSLLKKAIVVLEALWYQKILSCGQKPDF